MEALDNKYLIVISDKGNIDALKISERESFRHKEKIIKMLERGYVIILSDKYVNEEKAIVIEPVHMYFPNNFKS